MQAFVAARVGESYLSELVRIKKHFSPNSKTEPHITLVPPGKLLVTIERAKVELAKIKTRSIELRPDGIGIFRSAKSRIVHLRFNVNPALINLQKQLLSKFSGKVISAERHGRKDFKPHITLGRAKNKTQLNEILTELKKYDLNHIFSIKEVVLFSQERGSDPWQELTTIGPDS